MVNTDDVSKTTTVTDREISRATHLSLVEILFGSIGHGLKIPFAGQFLSLYQLNVLANSLNKDTLPRSSAVEISGIVAVMKSFSPAGEKLGPMVSILTQGILFWLGTILAGVGLIGQLIGGTFLALWSFLQPLLTYTLIFGFNLFHMLEFYRSKAEKEYPYAGKYLLGFIIGLIVIKIILAWAVISYSFFNKTEWSVSTKPLEKLISLDNRSSNKSVWKRAFKDLANPLFLLSFFLMAIFLWQIETDKSRLIWLSLRPLAIAFVIFYILRSPKTHQFFYERAQKSSAFKRFYSRAVLVIKAIESKRELTSERLSSNSEVNSKPKQ